MGWQGEAGRGRRARCGPGLRVRFIRATGLRGSALRGVLVGRAARGVVPDTGCRGFGAVGGGGWWCGVTGFSGEAGWSLCGPGFRVRFIRATGAGVSGRLGRWVVRWGCGVAGFLAGRGGVAVVWPRISRSLHPGYGQRGSGGRRLGVGVDLADNGRKRFILCGRRLPLRAARTVWRVVSGTRRNLQAQDLPLAMPAPDRPMHKPLAFAALLLALPAFAAVPQLVAPDEVDELLERHLEIGELADATAQAAFERRMQREVASLLATEGYFSPIVVLRQRGEELLLEVDPGPRSLIGSVEIEIVGDIDAVQIGRASCRERV